MNRLRHIIPLCLVLLGCTFAGCEESVVDPTTTNRYTINGRGFSNATVNGNGTATVLSVEQAINIVIAGLLNGQGSSVELNVDGTTPGEYPWSSENDVELATSSGTFVAVFGTTTIREVGQIGGVVSGSFSGTLHDKFDQSNTVEITGTFNAIR